MVILCFRNAIMYCKYREKIYKINIWLLLIKSDTGWCSLGAKSHTKAKLERAHIKLWAQLQPADTCTTETKIVYN
jgi:hypothetical protein